MRCKSLFSLLIVAFGLFCLTNSVFAQEASAEPAAAAAPANGGEKKLDIGEIIFGHVGDSHEWHFFEIGEKPVAMPLPMILYTKDGVKVMSSGHFEEWGKDPVTGVVKSNSHEGVHIEKGMKEKVVADDGSEIYDLSITKNVLSLLISVVLLLWIGFSVAKKYKAGGATKAPSGFQNAFETAILFIRDEVAIPNLGKSKHGRYMPLLLTLFFFIWINNLLGLLPGGANLTGNIAVTLCLSLISFLVMVGSANKHFWGHLLNPPGVPFFVKIVLVPIEIISLFIKPVALTIRLFANILAGHIIILCVISIIFIFAGLNKFAGAGFAPISIAFSIFMFMLELLVAAIQAFIFTNLTSVFIGSAIEEAHHHDDDHAHEPESIEIMM